MTTRVIREREKVVLSMPLGRIVLTARQARSLAKMLTSKAEEIDPSKAGNKRSGSDFMSMLGIR